MVIVVISAGNGGDSFTVENGNLFSTVDQDNDRWPSKSCARTFKSGWWHGRCHQSSLNGLYLNGSDEDPDHFAAGISWYTWLKSYKYFFTKSEMKIKLSSQGDRSQYKAHLHAFGFFLKLIAGFLEEKKRKSLLLCHTLYYINSELTQQHGKGKRTANLV